MEFEVMRQDLVRGLGQVAEAVASGSTLPVLMAALYELVPMEGLRLSGTDLIVGLRAQVPVAPVSGGAVAIEHARVVEWLGMMEGEKVKVKLTEKVRKAEDAATGEEVEHRYPQSVRFQCGRNYINVKGVFPADDFPTWPTMDDPPVVIIEADVLKRAINAVSWATQPNHPVREGVLVEFNTGVATFVALSEGWSAKYRADAIPKKGYDPFSVILPPKALSALVKLPEGEVEVYRSHEGHHLGLKWDGGDLVARTLHGDFPNYERLFTDAASGPIVWTGPTGEAHRLVKLAGMFAEGFVRLRWAPEGNELWAVSGGYSGDFSGAGGGFEGQEEIELAISPKMLAFALASIQADSVVFRIRNAEQAICIEPEESDRHSIIIMPMMVTKSYVERGEEDDDNG